MQKCKSFGDRFIRLPIIQEVLRKGIPWSPRVMLLADFEGTDIGQAKELVVNMLSAAAMLIASKWKSPIIPTITEWLIKVRCTVLMTKISAICAYRAGCMNAPTRFTQYWEQFTLSRCDGSGLGAMLPSAAPASASPKAAEINANTASRPGAADVPPASASVAY